MVKGSERVCCRVYTQLAARLCPCDQDLEMSEGKEARLYTGHQTELGEVVLEVQKSIQCGLCCQNQLETNSNSKQASRITSTSDIF